MITKYWNGLLKADKTAVEPYTMDELMGEGEDTIHNRCRTADKQKSLLRQTNFIPWNSG
jgi:hypothetical protein